MTDKTPVKAADAENTYTFSGWDSGATEGNVKTYAPEFTATAKASYTIIWLNGDGTQLDSKTYTEGQDEPTTDKTPTKESDAENTYTFSKWDNGVTDGNVKTYAPEFTATPKTVFTVIWLNGDGTELDRKTYTEGQDEPATDKTPTKEADARNTYTFSGWDNGVTDGNVKTYAPEFTATAKTVYTVIWLNGDGSQLDRKTYTEGQDEPATDKTPTKASDAENVYAFSKWDNGVTEGNAKTYAPEFTATAKASYTIIWLNGDGSQLDSKTYTEGQREPTTDKTPTKASDAENVYAFSKWDNGVTEGNVKTYAPEFTATAKTVYTVVWLNGDGTELDRKTYTEGQREPTTDKTPVKESDAENVYTFSKWDNGVTEGNVKTYAPEFIATAKSSAEYSVTVHEGSGSGQYKEGDSVPIAANPAPDGQVFDKWLGADGLTFTNGNQNSENATFTMPGNNVDLTAAFRAQSNEQGCYVATAVYGSYDCPEVWTLRRFRDKVLAKTWYGRLFIHLYYAVSPTAVKLFGDCEWFQSFFRDRLDKMVSGLQADGFESTPYEDKAW